MDDFVTFETAKKLKEKGFREECFARYYCSDKAYFGRNSYHPDTGSVFYCYNNDEDLSRFYIDAPIISQVLKWLRKERNLHIDVGVYPNGWNFFCCSCEKHNNGKFGDYNIYETLEMHNSYELAALAGIEYVLDNLI